MFIQNYFNYFYYLKQIYRSIFYYLILLNIFCFSTIRPVSAGSFDIVGNLEKFNVFSSAVPFKDLMFQSKYWGFFDKSTQQTCSVKSTFDTNGYATSLSPNCYITMLAVAQIANTNLVSPPYTYPYTYKPGVYIFKYTGTADFSFGLDVVSSVKVKEGEYKLTVNPSHNGGIQISISNFGTTYPRDFHLVHENDLATYLTNPFNDEFIRALSPYKTIRFMEWGKVNDSKILFNSGNVTPTTSLISASDIILSATNEASNFQGITSSVASDYIGKVAIVTIDGKKYRDTISGFNPTTKQINLTYGKLPTTTTLPISVRIEDYYNKTWDSRTPLSNILQTSPSGVAFEYMIMLGNLTNKNIWISVPTAADDNFVLNLLDLIDTKLNPGLKAYIEYTNEAWNSAEAFTSFNFNEAMSKKLNLSLNSTTTTPSSDAYHAYRAVQIAKLISQKTGENPLRALRTTQGRFIRVVASQAVNYGRGKAILDWGLGRNLEPNNGKPASDYVDMYALAPYFAAPKSATDVRKYADIPLTDLFNYAKAHIDSLYGTSTSPGPVTQIVKYANQIGVSVIHYEGGQHLHARFPSTAAPVFTLADSAAENAQFLEFNRSIFMHDLYAYNLGKWKSLKTLYPNTVSSFAQYNAVGASSIYGYWGALEASSQDPLSSQKFRALDEFVKAP